MEFVPLFINFSERYPLGKTSLRKTIHTESTRWEQSVQSHGTKLIADQHDGAQRRNSRNGGGQGDNKTGIETLKPIYLQVKR